MKAIRWIERLSRPRFRFLFDHRASNSAFGLLVIAGSLGAFLALIVGGAGILVEIVLGKAAVRGIGHLF